MERIELKQLWNDETQNLEMVAHFEEMKAVAESGGRIYIEHLQGDRKGSISYIEDPSVTVREQQRYNRNEPRRYSLHVHGTHRWDGRRNKAQASCHATGGTPYFAWLKDYEDGTVWAKFDAKAAREKLLAEVAEEDIHGHVLEVGDEVAYINARYGSGAELEIGTVDRFEASANSHGATVYTIIKNSKGIESKLQYPEKQVMKLQHGWDD